MTKRIEFMYVKKGMRELNEERWTTSTKEEKVSASTSSVASTPAPPSTPAANNVENKPDPGSEEKETAAGGKRRGSAGGAELSAKKPKNEVALLLNGLKSLKAKISKSTSAANDLLTMIPQMPEWAWANNEHMLNGIKQAFRVCNSSKCDSSLVDSICCGDFLLLQVPPAIAN